MQDAKGLSLISPAVKQVELNCFKHGAVIAKIISLNGSIVGNIEPQCPKCKSEKIDEEKKTADDLKARVEADRAEKVIINNLYNASIPARFQEHSFETFLEKSEEQIARKKRCQEYANDFPQLSKKGVSMIFSGATGTGKSHLACAILNHIIRHHSKTGLFITVIDAVRRVKETYKKSSKESEREAIRSFLNPDLLILDEVGVQFGSDTEKMILFEIINKRYENLKPTILLSNLAMENLIEFVGERIVDRMRENGGKVLRFKSESFRKSS